MPNIPVRGVGEIGVVTDINPQDAPTSSWSDARNVRFAEGSLSRYSVFRKVSSSYTYAKTPVGIFNGWSNGEGYLTTVFTDGSFEELHNNTAVETKPASSGYSSDQITVSTLGGLTYVNRSNDVPYYRERPGGTGFMPIPFWSEFDRCYSLRAFKDYLIALNVSKSGIDYPGMVKWSDAVQMGAPPQSWSTLGGSSLAGENVLNDVEGRLIDGLPLGDCFMIYGEHQAYRMDYIGAPFIFSFTKMFSDQGVIARNCIVDVENKHYVFGRSDIFVTDGITRQSIVSERIQKQIYSEIDFEQVQRCFCYHDRIHGEIAFCYPSNADDSPWMLKDLEGCNRAAVFNYKFNTWTFVDIPSLVGSTEASLVSTASWEDFGTWDEATPNWSSFAGQRPRGLMLCSTGNPALAAPAQSYILDDLVKGRWPYELDANVLWPAYAEALNRDLDELGAEIIGRKLVTRIVPQYRVGDGLSSLVLKVGGAATPDGSVTWGMPKTFVGYLDTKYDTRINGRYLSMRIEIPAISYAEVSGYDITMQAIAGR